MAAQMVKVTLPDGSVREVEKGTTVLSLAEAIGPRLARVTVGARFDGDDEIVDLRRPIDRDVEVEIVTADSEPGLEVIRHSASHVMADAILRLWPEAKLSIGPATDEGFYYDIDLEHRVSEDDLARIEAEMAKIVKEDQAFERCTIERESSLKRFGADGEVYKVELIEGIPESDELTVYRHGGFEDLCRGPHVPSTGYVKAFKLLRVAGAYWRGDENRPMLQRIYGTAYWKKQDLDDYLRRIEEAKKRDHRKLGKELGLFAFVSDVAPASPFFLPKGAALYNRLVDYMREKYRRYGYAEVITPQILDVELWKRSGHWDKYQDNMFFTAFDKAEYGVKPMNCPCHALMYALEARSYRELPLRMADFGRLHRYERAGATSGLTRVRTFCQDDGHIFCRHEQIGSEIANVIRLVNEVYRDFGFAEVQVNLSTRPEVSIGSDEIWENAEARLREALEANGVRYQVNPGDGAFYGPKIDFVVFDALRRGWQLGTIQLDFNMPERFGLEYVDEKGERARPVVVHRAVLGSIERFIGIVIEHFAGAFPLWLAPVQVRIATLNDACNPFGEEVAERLRDEGFRIETAFENAKIGAKIRDSQLMKIPYTAVIGPKEVESRSVAIRELGGIDHGTQGLDAFCAMMRRRIADRAPIGESMTESHS